MKLLYIEWADAISNPSWMNRSEANGWGKASQWHIKMCGWLVEETKEYIVLALGWKPADDFTDEQFVNLHKIPTPWIQKRKVIKI